MAYSVLEPQHIRVLKLEPSDQHDSIITCSLEVVPFKSATPQYEALSYVWGDQTERNEIILDGQPTSITRNLWTTLKYIRQPDTSRTLWIDAVCINQADIHERNEQVKQMGDIYSRASRVLIWLGPPNDEIEETMSTLQIPGALEGKIYEDFPKDIALGLQRILSQEWWHRIWVIQEHVLANADPTVGCGYTWLPWSQLSDALLDYANSKMDESGATIMDGSSTWAADAFAVLRHVLLRQQWNDTDYRSSTKATIADIFERTRGYQATDKRDQVFAIRDLLSEEDKEQFPAPDYAKQCSEVYQEATVAFIRSKKNLAFLMHAIEKDDLELGLPSWCVDFSKRLWDWGGYGNFAEGRESELTPEYMSALSHDPSAGTLKVLGGLLGQVAVPCPLVPVSASIQDQTVTVINAHTLRPEEPDSIPQMYMQFIREVLRISAMSYRIWAHRHDPQTAKERIAAGRVWKMVFGGGILFNAVDAVCVHQNLEKVDGDDRPREYWVVEAFVRKTCPWYADAIEGLGFFHPTPELPDSRRLMEALLATMIVTMRSNIGYWWCLVDTGYIARIEREVREGDRLYTIFGCRQPVVLRPCDGGYQLVAMAYSEDFYEDYHRTYEREVEREIITLR